MSFHPKKLVIFRVEVSIYEFTRGKFMDKFMDESEVE